MRNLGRRLLLVGLLISVLAPALHAVPIYIFPFEAGYYQWRDLDGKCVSSCGHTYQCPCWPISGGGFWINV